jgi:hypothetical protein
MKQTAVKDLAYYKANAEEDYLQVPISVLRYISQLEQQQGYSEEDLKDAFQSGFTNGFNINSVTFEEWFEKFKKK